jgi:hypothetical protein
MKIIYEFLFPDELLPITKAEMSTYKTMYPSKHLYDGKTGTFAHSLAQSHNGFLFKLELEYTAKISKIRVTNRKDCCKDRLVGFTVYIVMKPGRVNCGTINEVGQCSGKSGIVRILYQLRSISNQKFYNFRLRSTRVLQ